jgi:hypothetical protein
MALAVEAITELVVAAKIFDPIRNWVFDRAFPMWPNGEPREPTRSSRRWAFVVELTKCGYCVSVWPAFWFALFGPQWLVNLDDLSVSAFMIGVPTNLLINWVVIHRLSNWIHVFYERMKKGRVLTYDIELKLNAGELPWKPSTENSPDKPNDLIPPKWPSP